MNFAQHVRSLGVDHLDFGCSKGGSLDFAKRRLEGTRGLGIDIDPRKVAATREAGHEALEYDILKIPDEELVRFVILSHFLEHVADLQLVQQILRKACVVSREFVYVQQPFFDADAFLLDHGLKLYWSDWHGHRNRMTSLELWLTLRDVHRQGVPMQWSIHAHRPVRDSSDPAVLPLHAPIDQHAYDPARHGEKDPSISFGDRVFGESIALVTFPGVDHQAVLKKLRISRTLIDVEGRTPFDREREAVRSQSQSA